MIRSNPPWTEKILGKYWARIEAKVGKAWMPVALTVNREVELLQFHIYKVNTVSSPEVQAERLTRLAKALKKKVTGYREYGCGHYGCVMPTQTSGIVMKVTTDATEAAFVAAYLSLTRNQRPSGIVAYHKIFVIRNESHLKRPIFVLWRDEAQHVGGNEIRKWINDAKANDKEYYGRSFTIACRLIGNCREWASEVRLMTKRAKDSASMLADGVKLMNEVDIDALSCPMGRGPLATRKRVAYYLAKFDNDAMNLQSEPMGDYIGRGLHESLEAGLLLADVHEGNIGMPAGQLLEEIGMTPIITDPGHVIALDDRYNGVQIADL